MAGISTKEIKNRIRSMVSTRQITRAMEMVAFSKLRKAQAQVLNTRPYFETLRTVINDITGSGGDDSSIYLTGRPVKRSAFVVIAGDRGLAGGYNSNVLKRCQEEMEGRDPVILPIGRKAGDYFLARKIPLLTGTVYGAEEMASDDCFSVAAELCRMYKAGEIDEVFLAYTNFVSVLSQNPAVLGLLPLPRQAAERKGREMLWEPDSGAVLDAIVPQYLGGIIYGALCESRAAEAAARRTAMDAATRNAEEMIGDLRLKYNRARQAAITQELTEIVAGS